MIGGKQMNKQEAIEKLKEASWECEDNSLVISLDYTQEIISQINEPQKVVIPKFVAEWLEYCKSAYRDLQKVLSRLDDDEKVGDRAYDENDDLISEKVDMIARAWVFGYEVEKEKRYTVEIPNHNGSGYSKIYLAKNKDGKVELFIWSCYTSIEFADDWKQEENAQLTEKEIKKDFEWAFQFAKEVE